MKFFNDCGMSRGEASEGRREIDVRSADIASVNEDCEDDASDCRIGIIFTEPSEDNDVLEEDMERFFAFLGALCAAEEEESLSIFSFLTRTLLGLPPDAVALFAEDEEEEEDDAGEEDDFGCASRDGLAFAESSPFCCSHLSCNRALTGKIVFTIFDSN